jgi:adenosylhomocysteine nucleosidase
MISRRALLLIGAGLLGRLLAAEPVDVLLVGADETALRPVLAKVAGARAEPHAAWTLWTGDLSGKKVVLTQGEGDPLNAVAATTLAIRLHTPKLIVVFGASRPHDPSLRPGDIVVSESFAAFDGFISQHAEIDGGSHPDAWQNLPHLIMTPGEKEVPTMTFPADASARESALKLKPARGRVVAGVLGSANQINREADRIAWLRAHWNTSTEDGVSAHVAGCAQLLAVPVVGISVVDAPVTDAAEFVLRLMEVLK